MPRSFASRLDHAERTAGQERRGAANVAGGTAFDYQAFDCYYEEWFAWWTRNDTEEEREACRAELIANMERVARWLEERDS